MQAMQKTKILQESHWRVIWIGSGDNNHQNVAVNYFKDVLLSMNHIAKHKGRKGTGSNRRDRIKSRAAWIIASAANTARIRNGPIGEPIDDLIPF